MRYTPGFRVLTLVILLLFTVSCVSTQLPPISATGDGFRPLADEAALWEESRDEEEMLLENVRLYDDPELESYLEEIADRLNPPGMAANPEVRYRVRVIEDPTLNAFAYPHGSIYIHTGLLARMENEDQIATVLGHEMSHVESRHMLRYRRSARNKQIGLSVAAVAAAVVIAAAEIDALDAGHWGKAAALDAASDLIVGLGLQLAFLASINGYGRGLEMEADEGGFAKMRAAGYDLEEAPKVYQALLDDHGEKKKVEAFFFGSHPRLSERIENTRQYLAGHSVPGRGAVTVLAGEMNGETVGDDDAFDRRILPVVRDDARLNIELGRLKLAGNQLARVEKKAPEDPEAYFLAGRLRLAEATAEQDSESRSRLRAEAAVAFRRAIGLDSGLPGPHRELGLLLYQQEDYRGACTELLHYVEVAPEAEDVQSIQDSILDLQGNGHC